MKGKDEAWKGKDGRKGEEDGREGRSRQATDTGNKEVGQIFTRGSLLHCLRGMDTPLLAGRN